MKIHAKVTMCDKVEGVSRTTGEPWLKCNYVVTYEGKWANGSSCTRSLAFEVFGKNRLNDLKILKDQVGTLEFETKSEARTSNAGTSYYTNTIDILSWTPDAPQDAPKASAEAIPETVKPSAPSAKDDLPF